MDWGVKSLLRRQWDHGNIRSEYIVNRGEQRSPRALNLILPIVCKHMWIEPLPN
jgi:hypothetical protein